jgi:hypothetical protein
MQLLCWCKLDRSRGPAALKYGSTRRPGADLSRLPLGLDLHAISIAEGVRAAAACGVLILADEWLHWPPLVYAAIAANTACFCDPGGPIKSRIVTLLCFSLLGGLLWGAFGLLTGTGPLVFVPLAALAFFCNAFVRVWGPSAQTVGNFLSVVVILGLDRPLTLHQALAASVMFAAGGFWATILTAILWRVHQYRPAREAVAEVWRDLAALTGDLRQLTRRERIETAEWDDHARAHRRALRLAIEYARGLIMDLMSGRGPPSLRGSQALLRLEAGDQLFGALIALTDLVEEASPARRQRIHAFLRVLQPLLMTLARLIARDIPAEKMRMGKIIDRLSAMARGRPRAAGARHCHCRPSPRRRPLVDAGGLFRRQRAG